jgi:hypothetical protein
MPLLLPDATPEANVSSCQQSSRARLVVDSAFLGVSQAVKRLVDLLELLLVAACSNN